ncbi:MAG: site-specific integrase [Planctomycetaceae bacterium]|nr:site-specific integrase [Planctomycetaceae bacterium]
MARTPKYSHHKATGQAFVRINGSFIYLGKYGSPESHDAYDREIVKWRRQNDLSAKFSTTVAQLALAYTEHAKTHYRNEDGTETGEVQNIQYALKPLVRMFRNVPCAEFGPLKLKAVREDLMKRHCRVQVNNHIYRIRRAFRWGVENEMVPGSVLVELEAVKSLAKGRTHAKESDPVVPVPQEHIDAVLKVATPNVAAMVQLQLLTGARVSEIRLMQVGDIDTTGEVWLYRPKSHKNAWRRKDRTIFIGPKGQAILMPFIADAVQSDLYVFRSRKKENKPYTLHGYLASIRGACKKAKVPNWSPGQLRHNAATNINRKFGDIDGSRVMLGHSEKTTTQIYAERDFQKATEIARKIG